MGDEVAWYNVTVNAAGTPTLEGKYGLADHYATIEATAEALQLATDNSRDMDVAYLVICGEWQARTGNARRWSMCIGVVHSVRTLGLWEHVTCALTLRARGAWPSARTHHRSPRLLHAGWFRNARGRHRAEEEQHQHPLQEHD